MKVQSEIFNQLIEKIAMMSESDQRELLDYWNELLGPEYSKDQVKDYTPRGKGRKTSDSQSSGQLEASSGGDTSVEGSEDAEVGTKEASVKTASKIDRDVINQYWAPLNGSDWAGDLVRNYEPKGKPTTKQVQPIGKRAAKEKKTKNVLNLGW